jgi:hypothetical protein
MIAQRNVVGPRRTHTHAACTALARLIRNRQISNHRRKKKSRRRDKIGIQSIVLLRERAPTPVLQACLNAPARDVVEIMALLSQMTLFTSSNKSAGSFSSRSISLGGWKLEKKRNEKRNEKRREEKRREEKRKERREEKREEKREKRREKREERREQRETLSLGCRYGHDSANGHCFWLSVKRQGRE